MKRFTVTMAAFLAITVLCTGTVLADRDGLVAPDVKYVDDYTLKGSVNYFTDVDPADKDGNIHVIVEIPKGTTGKWEVDADSGNIIWEFKKGKPRTVDYLGGYPANYGTAPKTLLSEELGGEGESVDVILIGAQQNRGAVVKAKLIGILKITEGDGVFDDKLFAVALGSPEYAVNDVDELNARFNNAGSKVASWFTSYKGPDSGMTSRGMGTYDEARRLFYATMKAFKENR
jgi:inorganic pyrophosphatase